MKRLVVTCEDGSRYEGTLEDEQIQQPEIVDGVLIVRYRLPSPAVSVSIEEAGS